VGLVDFEGDGGPGILLEELVKRYADISLEGSPSRKDPFSSLVTGNSTQPIQQQQQQKIRRKKEALRQIALMFSLLKEYQPVELITQLLAADDDAKIDKVIITDGGTGYLPPDIDSVKVTFPNPPTFGTAFGGSDARGKAILRETGRILKVEVIDGGSGYTKPPVVEISHPKILDSQSRALAKAILGKGNAKGSIERIEVTNFGTGFYSAKDNIDVKIISPPDSTEGKTATARAILEYQVVGVEIFDPGRGYAAERPIAVTFDPPPADGGRTAAAISYPAGKSTIFKSFLSIDDRYASNTRPSDTESPSRISPSWVQGPTSLQLLTLLPSGVGLEFDASLKRYVLATAQADQFNDSLYGTLEGMSFKPLNPIFGVRGRSPIEREKSLNASTVIRFIASGAVCSSVAHLVLTPIDVVKTKVQTKPDVYSGGIVNTFKKVLDEEGSKSFFTGWEPTFLGFFLTGGVSFFFTEYFRRLFTSLMVTNLMTQAAMSEIAAQAVTSSYEIPIVAASAATSGFLCCFILSPFDAVRIRTVTQPDFADSPFGVLPRIIREEGVLSLFSALNACILKEVPYNVVKFLVFDGFTQWAYECIPAAQEDIRLSLTISLVGGTCGGIAASIVSNPADVIVSEMKKSKSDMGPLEAASVLKQRAGWKAFSCGLQLRMIFYSLLVSLQFLLYDTVRIALGVGSDDMKLFLNVLGAALKETSDL
jgi:solute carrier family 25 phosphate transporter 3